MDLLKAISASRAVFLYQAYLCYSDRHAYIYTNALLTTEATKCRIRPSNHIFVGTLVYVRPESVWLILIRKPRFAPTHCILYTRILVKISLVKELGVPPVRNAVFVPFWNHLPFNVSVGLKTMKCSIKIVNDDFVPYTCLVPVYFSTPEEII